MQKIVHELKYGNNSDIGILMGELCGRDMNGSDFLAKVDYLIPVPLHLKRERQRGYNQSGEICKGIAEHTNIKMMDNVLMRAVNNPTQTSNSRFDRWNNVDGIFTITNSEALNGKHILLVDDVITTGSTIESCVKTLIQAADVKVSVLALAVAT